MPKLAGMPEKYWGKYRIDKENDTTVYSDDEHVYISKNDNSKFISVTTLIHKYTQEFDEEFWSAYKALEILMDPEIFSIVKRTLLTTKKFSEKFLTKFKIDKDLFYEKQNEIKLDYERKRNESCERGTAIHAMFENSFYNRTDFNFDKYGFADLAGTFDCKKDYYRLDLENGVYPEFLISLTSRDGILKVAGQIDLLVKKGNDIWIIDWKGLDINTPILTTCGWKTMGTLTLEDVVFDKDGNPTKILHISEEHHNPCYEIKFDNGDSLIADEDHRWLITFSRMGKNVEKVMTTKELHNWVNNKPRKTYNIPRIMNAKPLNIEYRELPIDPYVLGVWLGDGSKSCGIITNVRESLWNEVKRRGFQISDNLNKNGAEMRTIYGLRGKLSKIGVLNNKHIPADYLLASYEQRLDLLRGLMDTDGFFHKRRKRFVMETSQKWQAVEFAQLLSSLGFKPTVSETINKNNGKVFSGWMCCWTNGNVNPFLTRNMEEFKELVIKKDNNSFRNIISVSPTETVTTKCIEVDSPTHTYLAGDHLIVTHNTNKKIEKTSYYNKTTHQHTMMKYPLNNLMDTNFWHYSLQLSTYAYLLQQINPEFNIRGLKLVHIDHDNVQHEYDVEYLKDDVERMLKHFKKKLKVEQEYEKLKPVIS